MPLNEAYRATHEALMERVSAAGVKVEGRSNRLPGVDWHGIYAAPKPYPIASFGMTQPRIELARARASEIDDYLDETITLAHEFGHHLSYEQGLRTTDYESGIAIEHALWPKDLTDQQREAIYAEETLAWDLGRQVLETLGFKAWSVWDERRADGLREYRARLALPEAP